MSDRHDMPPPLLAEEEMEDAAWGRDSLLGVVEPDGQDDDPLEGAYDAEMHAVYCDGAWYPLTAPGRV